MHGVCLRCFTRRHIEKSRIKETRLVDEAAKGSVACITDFAIRVIMSVDVEPILGYLLGPLALVESIRGYSYLFVHVQPRFEKIPKLFVVRCIGKPASHANDCQFGLLRCSWHIVERGNAFGYAFLDYNIHVFRL